MPKRQDYGGKKKNLKVFPLNLITELTQPSAADFLLNKLHTAHSGDFVVFQLLPTVTGERGTLKTRLSNYVIKRGQKKGGKGSGFAYELCIHP